MGNYSFLIQTAFRDSRKDRGRLFLFMSSIILGIAALVAINSFNDNLLEDIEEQSKSILGADVAISGDKEMPQELLNQISQVGQDSAVKLELFSMAFLPKQEESQFVRINALKGDFPFYGELKVEPTEQRPLLGKEAVAFVDEGMMLQYELTVGDTIKLGEANFKIVAALKSDVGNMGMGATFAPPIYIGYRFLKHTKLVQPGSLLEYNYYFKVSDDLDVEAWRRKVSPEAKKAGFRVQTIEGQRENLRQAFSALNGFLNLVALVSLLLACIGVASSVLIYIKNKVNSIAILRCIGMQTADALFVYFFQILSISLISVVLGAALGSIIQLLLPVLFESILPYKVEMAISWPAIAEGILIGFVASALFASIPLLSIRKISPLRTIRNVGDADIQGRDPLKILVYALIGVFVVGFLYRLSGALVDAIILSLGVFVAFLILFGMARLLVWMIKRYFPRNLPFTWKQGLSNLYRPNNQTTTLLVTIGLGTSILTSLFIIQSLALNNVASMGADNQPNMILFGIERKKLSALDSMTQSFSMPVIQKVPVVTMDLIGWQGKSKQEWLEDSSRKAEDWAINREARVSFQKELGESDELLEGEYQGVATDLDHIEISLAQRYADAMDLDIGDELIWNVQGAIMKTYVGSIRKLDFTKLESRFFILFPTGVLEDAPQFNILVTKSPNKQVLADYRSAVVKQFPNVSVVDLTSILATLNEILTKVSYIIQFMAAFSLLIGLIVLLSSLLLSKFQRIRESVILRTLGAVRKQLLQIYIIEYLLIGALSAFVGISIAILSSYLLSVFVFDFVFNISWLPLVGLFLFVCLLTTFIGVWNSRDVIRKSPLVVLRREQ